MWLHPTPAPALASLSPTPTRHAMIYKPPEKPCAAAAELKPSHSASTPGANKIAARGFLPSRAGLWSSESTHYTSVSGPGGRLVLGCYISTWSQSKGAESFSKWHPSLLDEHTQPWGAHGLVSRPCWRRGSSARDASRGVLADSCLRVPLGVPPCDTTGLQKTITFEI